MRIQISHNANPDNPEWFIVLPLPGETERSVASTRITNEMAVQSLLDAGRTVCELDVEPWQGHGSGRAARAAARERS